MFVKPAPLPTKAVAVKVPVEGTKLSFVDEVFCGKLPVVVVTHVGYTEVAVVVSSVIAIFVAFVAVVALVALVAVAALPPIERPEAVPVKFVATPLDGVPSAPPLVTKAPTEPTATPKAVTTPVPVVIVEGATPAPPPIIKAFAAKTDEDAQVVPLEK